MWMLRVIGIAENAFELCFPRPMLPSAPANRNDVHFVTRSRTWFGDGVKSVGGVAHVQYVTQWQTALRHESVEPACAAQLQNVPLVLNSLRVISIFAELVLLIPVQLPSRTWTVVVGSSTR